VIFTMFGEMSSGERPHELFRIQPREPLGPVTLSDDPARDDLYQELCTDTDVR
jgi:hypothetical protein